jgi:hypothetical protein
VCTLALFYHIFCPVRWILAANISISDQPLSPLSSSCTTSHGPLDSEICQSRNEILEGVLAQGTSPCAHVATVIIYGNNYIADERYTTTIDIIPDDVLIEIFNSDRISESSWRWERLVHVCRRWRRIIFASPGSLHIRLVCNRHLRTPARKYLDIWPFFPIAIEYFLSNRPNVKDDFIAAIEHPDRVYDLRLEISSTAQFVKLAAVMQRPFPALTNLKLRLWGTDALDPQGGFLGGSAPSLRVIELHGIPFPELPTLLLSTRDLVTLQFTGIPPTGYISPEAMVACLAALTRLNSLSIEFAKPTPRLERKHLHPLARTVLPALTYLWFGGDSDYLEHFVARLDCPRLNSLRITFGHQLVDFQVSQLFKFIDRSEDPRLTSFGWVDVCAFTAWDVGVKLCRANRFDLAVWITFTDIRWQSSHIVQMFAQLSAHLSDVCHLHISLQKSGSDLDYNQCVQLLLPFTSLRTLHVGGIWALDDVIGGMAAAFLPALDLLYLNGYPESYAAKIKTAFQLSGRSITFINSLLEFESYLDKSE